MKVVIYTAIFGGYDKLKQPRVEQSAEMIFLTDQEQNGRAWNTRLCERVSESNARNARWAKTHPPEADVSIWIDGSLELLKDVGAMALDLLGDADIAMYHHPQRDCVYEECKACVYHQKDDKSIMLEQMTRYRLIGFPEKTGLVASGMVVRRHNSLIESLNNDWWNEIENGSKRDQLSFNFCLWKNPQVKFKRIAGSIYDGNLVKLYDKHHDGVNG